ncbi:spermine synthase isoform X2 [Condylostylus longicornis]|uniref:spermine synthase isoform X2 n=1 Tax=Condylostylus longicornis TaxID=2530218 RepID=UPI00244DC7F6|nr:spermine synthase isoform X2 [Condylostylus longicornis]
MSANTVLFDFTIDPSRIGDDSLRADAVKLIRSELERIFSDLKFTYDMHTVDGYFVILSENKILITIRFYNQGLITINIEYYLEDAEESKLNFDTSKRLENTLAKKLKVLNGQILPPIKRGNLPRYFPSSDERIIEYDIDKILFEERSEYQKIQIVHSKTLGNMLILDELQNIADVDLIYTETLMQRGIENYKGKEICILGGGDGALLYELLKEEPKYVVMLEIDELVMQACNKYMNSICGDVLEKRKGDNYEIIVGDCMDYMKRFIQQERKFDYVFGDLTDIPISETPTGEIWDFIRSILEHSFKILKPDGKFLTHGNGSSCPESLRMYEDQLKLLKPPVKFTTAKAFVPSFMEEWVFYQVSLA